MFCDGFADRYPELHGHSIPNHSTNPFEAVVSIRFYKLVLLGERLKDRAFPQRNTSILFRMAEAAIAEAVELRRDGRRRLVPLHAAVNA